jgi:hypothetical protein
VRTIQSWIAVFSSEYVERAIQPPRIKLMHLITSAPSQLNAASPFGR